MSRAPSRSTNRRESEATRIAVCEYLPEAGVPEAIVSLGRIPGPRPKLISPARPERGRLLLGGRAEWCESLAAWRPFDDPSVTHGLLLSNVLYSGGEESAQVLGALMAEARETPQAVEYPYPHLPFGNGSLPRALFFRRRDWGQVRRLFSKQPATRSDAFRAPAFATRTWNGLPFIPSDLPKHCEGLTKSPWNPLIDRCVALRRANERRLEAWARPVRVRPKTDIVTFLEADRLHGFLRAVRLWKFPAGTVVRVVSSDLDPDVIAAADEWPEGFSFHRMAAEAAGFRDATARLLAAGNRASGTEKWIWLDAEAIAVGLNRAATLFSGREWDDADWGAPGSLLVNKLASRPGAAGPSGWPELETVHWLGEPATLLDGRFVARLLEAWKAAGEGGVFEEFASRYACETGAGVRLANLHAWGWRML